MDVAYLAFCEGSSPSECVCVCVCYGVVVALSKLEHLMRACDGDPELCHLYLTHTHCPFQIHILSSTCFFILTILKAHIFQIRNRETAPNTHSSWISEWVLNQSISELVMVMKKHFSLEKCMSSSSSSTPDGWSTVLFSVRSSCPPKTREEYGSS